MPHLKISKISSQTYARIHIKYPLFLSGFDKPRVFSTDFWKQIRKISYFVKIRPVGTELSRAQADGRTFRRTEFSSRFAQFCAKRLKATECNKHRHYTLRNNLYRVLISNFLFLVSISMLWLMTKYKYHLHFGSVESCVLKTSGSSALSPAKNWAQTTYQFWNTNQG